MYVPVRLFASIAERGKKCSRARKNHKNLVHAFNHARGMPLARPDYDYSSILLASMLSGSPEIDLGDTIILVRHCMQAAHLAGSDSDAVILM